MKPTEFTDETLSLKNLTFPETDPSVFTRKREHDLNDYIKHYGKEEGLDRWLTATGHKMPEGLDEKTVNSAIYEAVPVFVCDDGGYLRKMQNERMAMMHAALPDTPYPFVAHDPDVAAFLIKEALEKKSKAELPDSLHEAYDKRA